MIKRNLFVLFGFVFTISLNLFFVSRPYLHYIFFDYSHPKEFRLSTFTLAIFFILPMMLVIFVFCKLMDYARKFKSPWGLVLKFIVLTFFWFHTAMSISGSMVPDQSSVWLWYEPFMELFYHPVLTPIFYLISLAVVLSEHVIYKKSLLKIEQ